MRNWARHVDRRCSETQIPSAAASVDVRVGHLTPEDADVLGALALADQVRKDADRAALTVG